MTRLLHPIAVQLLILLLIAISLIIVAAHVLMTDPIRPSFLQYSAYLPGEARPEIGCSDVWDWSMNYGFEFTCVFRGRDEVQVYGYSQVITGTSIAFTEARIGDVLTLLDDPLPRPAWMSRRSRSQLFDWHGIRVYLYRSRNLFEVEHYLTFWRPLLRES